MRVHLNLEVNIKNKIKKIKTLTGRRVSIVCPWEEGYSKPKQQEPDTEKIGLPMAEGSCVL